MDFLVYLFVGKPLITIRLALVIVMISIHAVETSGEVVVREGDWIVVDEEVRRGQQIRLNGNLILPKNSQLTLEDSTLEIVGDYSREHNVTWSGGTLVTKNSTLGGFVNDAGTPIHTAFHLYDGLWQATDTTVAYSYGISFHWSEGKGILRGTRLQAGPRPDAIILSGEADVELVDSTFPIGLGLYVDQGGSAVLDLLPNEDISATFDRSNLLPGVKWRLALRNCSVERWFLFVRQIGGWQPPAEITLASSRNLIVSLLGHNLKGDVTLTRELENPLRIGNLTLKNSGSPADISMFALYLSGEENDLTVQGKSHICELMMHAGGKLRVLGDVDRNDLSLGCTTLDLKGTAKLEIEHVHLGRPLNWQGENEVGEVNVSDQARFSGKHISVRDVRFRTEQAGCVELLNVTQYGNIEKVEHGGPIQVVVSDE